MRNAEIEGIVARNRHAAGLIRPDHGKKSVGTLDGARGARRTLLRHHRYRAAAGDEHRASTPARPTTILFPHNMERS
ncbi:hypothetical protein [Nocardia carnea]|uniref:hypothetical protein n=1 Tax=Nocardia carnea TaxID=37328 RepID=UPI002457318E|nr:hypothetical protein [Nocardia carnea]